MLSVILAVCPGDANEKEDVLRHDYNFHTFEIFGFSILRSVYLSRDDPSQSIACPLLNRIKTTRQPRVPMVVFGRYTYRQVAICLFLMRHDFIMYPITD